MVRGHLAAFVAPANGGKTTLFRYFSENLTGHHLDVFYINVDGNPSDLKRHYSHAEKFGYMVISPDARDGKNTIDALSVLRQIADSDADLSNHVYIIDTLKKFVDMLHKAQLKETLQMFRKLSVKGATIALLCHSNKYKDANGKQIYEGTVDLRNDVDELIYLDYSKDEVNKTQDITTTPDKVRANFEPVSYRILFEEDRKVFKLDEVSIPVSAEHKELIDLISEAILNGDDNQQTITSYVSERMVIGKNKIRDFLLEKSKGDQPLWRASKTGSNNALRYTIV